MASVGRPLSIDLRLAIRAELAKGTTHRAIAVALGVCRRTILKYRPKPLNQPCDGA